MTSTGVGARENAATKGERWGGHCVLELRGVTWASSENGECVVRNHLRRCAAEVQREEDVPAEWHGGEGTGSRARQAWPLLPAAEVCMTLSCFIPS